MRDNHRPGSTPFFPPLTNVVTQIALPSPDDNASDLKASETYLTFILSNRKLVYENLAAYGNNSHLAYDPVRDCLTCFWTTTAYAPFWSTATTHAQDYKLSAIAISTSTMALKGPVADEADAPSAESITNQQPVMAGL